MKKQIKIREHVELAVDSVTLAVFFMIFFIGGYAILDAKIVDSGTSVDEEISSLSPSSQNGDFDFNELKSINPEIIAWLRIDNTGLDYPIVQANDNSKYLVRNYRSEYNTAGAIFVDSRNNKFSDDFTIIYGHRVDGVKMFGELTKFSENAFFSDHTTGTLYTENGVYDLKTIAYAVLNIGTTKVYKLRTNKNGQNEAITTEVLSNAKNQTADYGNTKQLLMLSTCDKDTKNYRDVLLLSMTKR